MGKRCPEPPFHELTKKKRLGVEELSSSDIKCGSVLTDITGKKWKLGRSIGTGAFGEIYLASDIIDKEVTNDSQYVAKVESHSSGPLFVEINCYLRIAKPEMIDEWKKENNIKDLGMPYYIASGSHKVRDNKYRFLIISRYEKNLEELHSKNYKFNLKTVLVLSMQILDILKYIHSKGYVHSDIKASNILLSNRFVKKKQTSSPLMKTVVRYHGCTPFRTCKVRKMANMRRNLRLNENLRYLEDMDEKLTKPSSKDESNSQAYLLDYGLASKYLLSNGEHKPFCVDERKAHAGTILFCSRDAHQGMQSRRSDLECLGYNMIYWLTSYLPWMDDTEEPKIVQKKKLNCMENVKEFLNLCFVNDYPEFLCKYFNYLTELEFEEEPNYDYCKNLFRNAIKEYGYKDNLCLDFDNFEGWGKKQKKIPCSLENKKIRKQIVFKIIRSPLRSNLPIKPILRKRLKVKAKTKKMNWAKALRDPETIIKEAKFRERRTTESTDMSTNMSILNLNINELNPTPAMLEVYNKILERINSSHGTSPTYKGDVHYDHIEGYTAAMMAVCNRKKEREEMEAEQLLLLNSRSNTKGSSKQKKRSASQLNRRQETHSRSTKSQTSISAVKKEAQKRSKTTRRNYSLRG